MAYIGNDTCPICGSADVAHVHASACAPQFNVDLAPDFTVRAGALAAYSQCNACGVLYQNPRMDDAQIGRYYGEGIYRRTLGISDERMDADEAHRAQVDAGIIRRELSPAPQVHLDVGASRGYLLQAVGAMMKQAVEPTPGRVLFRDIAVADSLDVNKFEVSDMFSLITAIHVLEHEPHPVEYLRKLRDLLAPISAMVVEVPSWQSPGGPLRLAHLYHWAGLAEFETTAKLAGLKVVKHLTTPHNLFILERSQE